MRARVRSWQTTWAIVDWHRPGFATDTPGDGVPRAMRSLPTSMLSTTGTRYTAMRSARVFLFPHSRKAPRTTVSGTTEKAKGRITKPSGSGSGTIPPRSAGATRTLPTNTEVVLDSADRVDVVYYGPDSTVAIEVKSSDSDDTDLRRGIFQCIKYRAVMEAMDIRQDAQVDTVLVTQRSLPSDLRPLLRLHGIGHFKAPNHL